MNMKEKTRFYNIYFDDEGKVPYFGIDAAENPEPQEGYKSLKDANKAKDSDDRIGVMRITRPRWNYKTQITAD